MDAFYAGIGGVSGFLAAAQREEHVHLSVGDGCIGGRDC
jgi:hypothetical protein